MSKKQKYRSSHSARRNIRNIANAPLHRSSINLYSIKLMNDLLRAQQARRNLFLSEISDRRRHMPRPMYFSPKKISARPAQIKNQMRFKPYSQTLSHHLSDDTIVCVRRNRRREVLFARGRAGRVGAQKKHHRNETSKLICRKRR